MSTLVSPPTARTEPGLSPLVLLCLAATWLVWGSTYLAIKFALLSFPPFFQMGTRFLCAGLLLFAWMHGRGVAWPDARQWRNAIVVGTLMLGGGMGGTAVAEVSVGSGLVVAFIAVMPLMIAALNLFWGLRPGRLELAGIALGLLGVLMLTQGTGFQASPAGLVAIVTACVCWALGSVLSQRTLPMAPGAMGFASEMICGGVVLLALSLTTGERPAWPPQSAAVLAWWYLVVFGSLIAFNAYMLLLSRASAALASSYSFVNPVIAMLLGVAVLGEAVTGFEWAAAGVVLAGVVLMLRGSASVRA
jgi:drug/metabolite transporter (DMT)-like permease